MKLHRYFRTALTILTIGTLITSCGQKTKKTQQPNIIYILADDLGYGDLSCYGQTKFETPNIDQLAEQGMRFTDNYAGSPVCAPSRCVLLTGLHSGHAYIRGNDEWNERGHVWDYERMLSDSSIEGQRPLPANTHTLGSIMQSAGYVTGVFGKWGLGAPGSEGEPLKQGFNEFYGYNCQRQAHDLYPNHLWENSTRVILNNDTILPHDRANAVGNTHDEKEYEKFIQKEYAPELIHNKAIDFIKNHKDKPFFMYYATVLPHVPLQVPHKYLDKYHEKYGDEEPYSESSHYFPSRYPRAAYAGMINCLDDHIGELVATLKKEGLYENTIIVFTSDNGPAYNAGVDVNFFDSSGPLATGPMVNGYGRTKGFVYEAGIRVPLIVSWPDKIAKGTVNKQITSFQDWMPTLCDIARLKTPENTDGRNLLPTLLDSSIEIHKYLYWEFPEYNGQQAVRIGKWKAVRKNIQKGNLEIELYDLEADIKEAVNVADQHPEIIEKVEEIFSQEHTPSELSAFRMKALGDSEN